MGERSTGDSNDSNPDVNPEVKKLQERMDWLKKQDPTHKEELEKGSLHSKEIDDLYDKFLARDAKLAQEEKEHKEKKVEK